MLFDDEEIARWNAHINGLGDPAALRCAHACPPAPFRPAMHPPACAVLQSPLCRHLTGHRTRAPHGLPCCVHTSRQPAVRRPVHILLQSPQNTTHNCASVDRPGAQWCSDVLQLPGLWDVEFDTILRLLRLSVTVTGLDIAKVK